MKQLEEISENLLINTWVRHFVRAPHQVNKPHETDAEMIELEQDPEHYLAITIDTVAEEITLGFYREARTMGWVSVMASVSDLAAVGADPLGLVISVSIEPQHEGEFSDGIARGMAEACQALGVFILGGDTNSSPTTSLTGCAIGLVPRNELMTRRGCKPGDVVFITGPMGCGNALGLVKLANLPEDYFPESLYRPMARLKEASVLRKFANCCMDTSDGFLTTLDQLMRINQLGFLIDSEWEKILSPRVLQLCAMTQTPPWLMLAAPHGEFELVFTIPEERTERFAAHAAAAGIQAIRVGRVQESPTISLQPPSRARIDVDMAPLRNLFQTVGGDVERYLKEFRAFGEKWGLERRG
jgi:thiamine-monophosphate kinase